MALSTPQGAATTGGAVVRTRLTSGKRDWKGLAFVALLLACLFASLVILVTVVLNMWSSGSAVLTERLWDFLTAPLATDPNQAGLGQAIRGTLELVAIVIVVAIPLGVACGVYLEEYASKSSRFAQFTAVNIRNLAGVPSIVYGILGLAVFVKLLGDNGTGGLTGGRSVISGGLTLAVLVLPIVVITTAEALRAVPSGIREGALAVGATKWETTKSFVLPSAAPGILTGTVIAIARAAGEAAPLILVGAVTGIYQTGEVTFVEELRGPFTAIPIAIFSWARQPGEDFKALTGAGAIVLLVLIFILNGAAIWLRNRYERKW